MRDSELRSAPPVPPRRLKRKTRPVIGSPDGVAKAATTPVLRSERRLKLPPPPPPPAPHQRIPIRQRIHPVEIPPVEKSSRSSPRRSSDFYNSSGSINKDKQSAVDDVDLRTPLSTFGTTLCRAAISKGNPFGRKTLSDEPPRRHSKDRAVARRPNEYPPLFFTIQDFQEVMADVENSYSRTLRNMTTFEPTPRPRRHRDVLKRDDVTDLPETPKGQVLFRVTTTNVPFEKCLNGWGDSGNDPNHFIFEDYVDRRQFPPQRREPPSKKLVLFGDDTFDRDDEEQSTSTSRTTTRVRFLVDPPGEDTTGNITDLDSLQNIDSLPPDNNIEVGDAVLEDTPEEEIPEDEFGDIPFTSLLSSTGSSLLAEPSEDSTSSRTDFQTILVTATVEKIPGPKKQREDDAEGVKLSGEDARVNSSTVEATSGEKDTGEKLLGVSAVEPRADETEKNSPTVKARRNSFLMNMLQDENEPEIKEKAKEKVACEVVATHPKTPIRSCASRVDEMRSSTAVEAKNKLLGELSSNFSAVRLKPATMNGVDNLRRENCDGEEGDSGGKLSPDLDSVLLDSNVVKCNKVNEEPIIEEEKEEENKKSRILRKEPRTSSAYVCSQKTDQFIDRREKKYFQDGVVIERINQDEELIEGERDIGEKLEEGLMENYCKNNDEKSINIMNKNDDYNVESTSRSSVDKCAIVRRCNDNNIDDITYNNNNNNNNNDNNNNNNNVKSNNNINDNNDNNAMTPVDLSYDQSPKVISIIPGSVKSFVKFYEIRGETNVGLNVSENPSTPKIRIEEISGNENTATDDSGEKNSENYLAKHPGEIENDIKYTIVARKEIRTGNKVFATQNQKPIVDSRNDRFDKSARRIVTGEARLSPSHFMPEKDRANHGEMGKESQIATKSSASSKKLATRTRNAVPEIVPGEENGPIDGETRGVVMSSTTSQSVPKSTTTTFDGRYTFYCTV